MFSFGSSRFGVGLKICCETDGFLGRNFTPDSRLHGFWLNLVKFEFPGKIFKL